MNKLDGAKVIIIGGTGSLGQHLTKRLLSGKEGIPASITIFSRDEDKQHSMRLAHPQPQLKFVIGDVRDLHSVFMALQGMDIVFNAAAMKHVPSCEEQPDEAISTNVFGTRNILYAIKELRHQPDTVIGVSSDKGVHPQNTYGVTKLLQEKLIMWGNKFCQPTRFVCVCYGNVLASRGSIIPVFQKQITDGGPVTVTDPAMTRFLISLDQAVNTLMTALREAEKGEIYIPIIPSATVGDIADAMIGDRDIRIKIIGKREGEKIHEVLVTEDDAARTARRGDYYVVTNKVQARPCLHGEYNSRDYLINKAQVRELLISNGLLEKEGVLVA
jgi:FlaA1/EpsC-like NDP-sugar epimerase